MKNQTIFTMILLLFILSQYSASESLKESWYIMRGKSNMKIKNYSAAIEAYEKAVELNSGNKESMKTLGVAYEKQGLTDKAIQQYEKYLQLWNDDSEVAFKTGDYLQWSRYSYRRNDAIKYYRLGLKNNDHKEYRHKLAKLLSSDKKTLDEAVTEYKLLLKSDPQNSNYRKEYRKLLLWDERYINDAIREYEIMADDNPDNYSINHELAQLYSRSKLRNRDAIRQYEKLVNKNPGNVKLREEYARALAADPSRFSDASKEFEAVLKTGGNNSTREAYADLLAGKATTRNDAAKQYSIVLKNNPGNTKVRLKYAQILGGSKSTLPKAVEQYHIVLRSEPRNAAAHRGLANAYAWMGDKDKALYHSDLAMKYAPNDKKTAELKKQLMNGREPFIGGKLNILNQPGSMERDWYSISGYYLTGQGRFNPSNSLTCQIDAGYGKFWSKQDTLKGIDGFVFKLDLEYRLSAKISFNVAWGYNSLHNAGDGNEVLIQYCLNSPLLLLKTGFKRELSYESLPALAGHDTWTNNQSKYIGSARVNQIFAELNKVYSHFEARFMPYLGWVSSLSVTPNDLAGICGDVKFCIPIKNLHRLSIASYGELKHYGTDRSELRFPNSNDDSDTLAEAGGYFSPQSYCFLNPRVEYRYLEQGNQLLEIMAGPTFQYSKDKKKEGSKAGIFLNLLYNRRFNGNLELNAQIGYSSAAQKYSKLTIENGLRYLF